MGSAKIHSNRRVRLAKPAILAAFCGVTVSCSPTALLSITAPTSTFTSPQGQAIPRTLRVGFINNTAFRAVFTYGTYDPLDKETSPTGFAQLRLEGNSSSSQSLAQPCRKVLSVGGEELKRLIEVKKLQVNDQRALLDGVNFSGAPANDPLSAAATEGTAQGVIEQVGVDFNCEGLCLFTFVQDAAAPGGFRIDFSFIPPE